jgi:hypothetical protein
MISMLHCSDAALMHACPTGLQDLVEVINKRFSLNFEEIGCAGEVVLKEDPDYEKFALEIR